MLVNFRESATAIEDEWWQLIQLSRLTSRIAAHSGQS